MRSTFIAAVIALVAPAVYAQIDNLPECASPCLLNNLSKSGCENPTDFKCVCGSEDFITAASECMKTECTGEDIKTALGAASVLCKSVGVDIDVPVPETTADATTVTETTTVADATTVTETTTVADATTVTNLDTYTTTDTVLVITTTTPTVIGTGNVTPPGNTTSPTVPVPTTSDSAAVKNIAGLGAAVMAVAALFAL